MDDFVPLDKPHQFGYLAAADGLGNYPAFRYRGDEKIIVNSQKEDDKAAADGFHQMNFGELDAPREVDYGYDLTRLNPMQLVLYGYEIGCELNPDFTIADCVKHIQEFMLSKPSYASRVTLIAQAVDFDYEGAQEEIRQVIRDAGGYLI